MSADKRDDDRQADSQQAGSQGKDQRSEPRRDGTRGGRHVIGGSPPSKGNDRRGNSGP